MDYHGTKLPKNENFAYSWLLNGLNEKVTKSFNLEGWTSKELILVFLSL